MDSGRRFAGSVRRGGFGYSERAAARRLGYAYTLYRARSWSDGDDVRGGQPPTLSYVYLSLIAAAFIQRAEPYVAACRPLCAGYALYTFCFCLGYGTAGLCVQQSGRGESDVRRGDARCRARGADHCSRFSQSLGTTGNAPAFAIREEHRNPLCPGRGYHHYDPSPHAFAR